jgi:zinc transporter ZupT
VCHEIPHELGNYAVLIKYGFTHFQALLFNLLSALACIIGFYVGVSISSGTTAATWIFAITAGMFIYIALVELVIVYLFIL